MLFAAPPRHSHKYECSGGQFCSDPCNNASAQAIADGYPPNRTSPVPNPNSTILGSSKLEKRGALSHVGEDLLNPPYAINNTAKTLSDRTLSVGLSLPTYDYVTHGLDFVRQIRFTQMGSLNMTHVNLNILFIPGSF